MCSVFQLAAQRSDKSFTEAEGNKDQEQKFMLDWAVGGFLPKGPAGFIPTPPAVNTAVTGSKVHSL